MRKLLVVLFAAAFVVGFAAPSFAAVGDNFSLDGRVKFTTEYVSKDKDASPTGESDDDLGWFDEGLRARVQYKSDALQGMVDIREDYFDEAWVRFQWGPGQWRMGKLYALTFNPITTVADPSIDHKQGTYVGLLNTGGVQYVIPMGKVTLSFAGMEHSASPVGGAGTGYEDDITLPALEGKLDFNIGPTRNNVTAAYRAYTWDTTGAGTDVDVSAYMAGIFGMAMLGNFNINYALWMDQNNYSGGPGLVPGLGLVANGTDVYDVDTLGWALAAGYRFNPMFQLQAGVGSAMGTQTTAGADIEQSTLGWSIAAPIQINKFFRCTPYVTSVDLGDREQGATSTPQGVTTSYGALWMVLF